MADYTGAQAANFTLNDGDRFTGSITINTGVTMTLNSAGGTATNTGNWSHTVEGRILGDTIPNWWTIKSSATNPTTIDWGGFVFAGVDSGQVISGLIIMHAAAPIYHTTAYTAANSDIQNLIIDACAGGLLNYQGDVNQTFGNVEIRNCQSTINATTHRAIDNQSTRTITYSNLWIHDCQFYLLGTFASTGTTTISRLIMENVNVIAADQGFYRASGTPTLNVTKIWCFNFGQGGTGTDCIFGNWTSGTLNIDGGIIHSRDHVFRSCLNANNTCDGVDFYMMGYQYLANMNFTNCYFAGGLTAGAVDMYDPATVFQPANVGTANGVSEYNTAPFSLVDSITSARATPNYPLTFTTDLTVSSITDYGATFAHTPNCPGESHIFIDDAARTVGYWFDLSDYVGIGIPANYIERVDFSGNNRLVDQLTSRSRTIANMLKPGTTYKARVAVKTLFGKWHYGSEQSFTTTGSAGGGGGRLIAGGLIV